MKALCDKQIASTALISVGKEPVRCVQVGKYKAGESEDFSGERVTRSVHESLERLGLKYIDLIICHDIESAVDMKQASCQPVCCSLCPTSAQQVLSNPGLPSTCN